MIDRALQVCPGTTVSLTCSHDGFGLTRWEIGAPIGCAGTATHSTPTSSDSLCGNFTINMVSADDQPALRMSTLVMSIDESLNGAVVICFAGPMPSDPQAGNLTMQVIGEIYLHMSIIQYPFILLYRSSFHSNC